MWPRRAGQVSAASSQARCSKSGGGCVCCRGATGQSGTGLLHFVGVDHQRRRPAARVRQAIATLPAIARDLVKANGGGSKLQWKSLGAVVADGCFASRPSGRRRNRRDRGGGRCQRRGGSGVLSALWVHAFELSCYPTVLADADHCQAVCVKRVRHADPFKPTPEFFHVKCHFTRWPPSTGRTTLLKTKYFGNPTHLRRTRLRAAPLRLERVEPDSGGVHAPPRPHRGQGATPIAHP